MKFVGAILAGGFSTRFGSDKAFAAIDGFPAWKRQRQVLAAAGAESVVLIRRPDQVAPPEVECWRDTLAEVGPIAGLQVALAKSTADFVAVLAVDMPFVTASWFERLWSQCKTGVGAVGEHEGIFEPLAAIYPREALESVEAQIQLRKHSLQALATVLQARGRMKISRLAVSEVPMLQSRNVPLSAREHAVNGIHKLDT